MKSIQFEKFVINEELLLELENSSDDTCYKIVKSLLNDINILRRPDIKVQISEHSFYEIVFQQEEVSIQIYKAPIGNNTWCIGKVK